MIESATVKLWTLRLENDPNADAYEEFCKLCELLIEHGITRVRFRTNANNRVVHVDSTDAKSTETVHQNFMGYAPLCKLFPKLRHSEIRPASTYRITPSAFTLERVASNYFNPGTPGDHWSQENAGHEMRPEPKPVLIL